MFVRLNDVTKRFGDGSSELTVIDGLSWELPASGMVAIVGRSGIGKSTLLHILGGLEAPSSGQVWLGEQALHLLSETELSRFRAQQVGFVFQFHHLLPEFSAIENVAMPLFVAGIGQAEALGRAAQILDRVGLADRAEHYPSTLSGGEQQRVALARALVHRPRLVLCDEPTGNLDAHTAQSVQSLLREIHQEQENLVVIVTHSLELARSMDEAYEMTPGGVLQRVP